MMDVLRQKTPLAMAASDVLLVLNTCPDEDTAARIARNLVESGLAACVNRIPVLRSTYRWQDRVVDEPEVLLIIKTQGERYLELEMRLKSLHPYDVPEIIAIPVVAGSAEYLAWLTAATRGRAEEKAVP